MHTFSCDLWLIDQHSLAQFRALAQSRLVMAIDGEQARAAAAVTPRRQKAIGIIPVHGVLEARPTVIGEMLGMSSYERIGMALDQCIADESVSGIVLDCASPGGMVYGCAELADKIYSARGTKPILAVANPMAASGCFWIASAADRLIVTPSGDVGSVGVIAEHVDLSAANERDGAKITVVRSSKSPYKAESTDSEPLTDEARANMQLRADAIYERFVTDLARFRGVSVDHVNEHFGKGRVVDSKRALAAGMVDRVGTLQDTAWRLAEGRVRLGGMSSQDQWELPSDRDARRERVEAVRKRMEVL